MLQLTTKSRRVDVRPTVGGKELSKTLFLDEERVRELLSMPDLIPAMTSALASLSAGTAVQPVRTVVPVEDQRGFLGLMPAYNKALGAKIVTFYPHNRGVHTHSG